MLGGDEVDVERFDRADGTTGGLPMEISQGQPLCYQRLDGGEQTRRIGTFNCKRERTLNPTGALSRTGHLVRGSLR